MSRFQAAFVLSAILSLSLNGLYAEDAPLETKLLKANEMLQLDSPKAALLEQFNAQASHPLYKHVFENMDFSVVDAEAARVMSVLFTMEELEALVSFRKSAVGQSINTKMPQFKQALGEMMQEEMQRTLKREADAGRLPALDNPDAVGNVQQNQQPKAAPAIQDAPIR
ncbi:MAG: DUF2059 domain-containing protein [Alphaproteobacteria bacterium]